MLMKQNVNNDVILKSTYTLTTEGTKQIRSSNTFYITFTDYILDARKFSMVKFTVWWLMKLHSKEF